MLYSRFLTIATDASALKTIHRTSGFFILIAVFLLGMSVFAHFDSWSDSETRASATTSVDYVAGLIGYLLAKLLFNDWMFLVALANGLVLRRYKSRVAATILILLRLFGTGLGLYMFVMIWQEPLLRALLLFATSSTVFSALCLLVAGRALAAAIKLHSDSSIRIPKFTSVRRGL
jgi:hypothetical protein